MHSLEIPVRRPPDAKHPSSHLRQGVRTRYDGAERHGTNPGGLGFFALPGLRVSLPGRIPIGPGPRSLGGPGRARGQVGVYWPRARLDPGTAVYRRPAPAGSVTGTPL